MKRPLFWHASYTAIAWFWLPITPEIHKLAIDGAIYYLRKPIAPMATMG